MKQKKLSYLFKTKRRWPLFYIRFASIKFGNDVCKNLRFNIKCMKRLLKGRKYSQEILKLICFLCSLLRQQVWNLFLVIVVFSFSENWVGRAMGNETLLGSWPYHIKGKIMYKVKLLSFAVELVIAKTVTKNIPS